MYMNDAKVTVYSADWCAFCHAAKDYLNKIGVKFTEKNVEENRDYMQEAVEKSGQTGIPVIDIDGKIIIGFDRSQIDATLKDKKIV
jgi:glutaredoxin-like YruB-family protein